MTDKSDGAAPAPFEFKPIDGAVVARIRELRREDPTELTEYAPAYLDHWSGGCYRVEFAEKHGCGLMRFTLCGRVYFSLPFGGGDRARTRDELLAANRAAGRRTMLGPLAEAEAAELAAAGWCVRENEGTGDYVYRQEDLANLRGDKYQAKRNFCHRFEKLGPWHYGPLNAPDALRVLAAWRAEKGDDFDEEAETESAALKAQLPAAKLGGVLYRGDEPVAFAFGEPMTPDMLLVSYEKAIPSVTGAFAMINREFARREGAGYKWLNRAAADGHPALAKAKESYHPARRIRKFYAVEASVAGQPAARLRWLGPDDRPAAVSLWQRVFGDAEPFIRSVIGSNPGLGVEADGRLAAMGWLLPREGARYVYALATEPDCRGRGFATAILDAAHLLYPLETQALVPGSAELIPFYERLGFAVTDRGDYTTMTRPPEPGYRVADPMN